MSCARNCGNLLNFVKVIPKTLLVPFFSGHGVNFTITLLTRLTLTDSPQTVIYHRNSHYRCYCGSIYHRKRFIHYK